MSVTTLPEAYAFLRMDTGTHDALLQNYIDEVEAAIAAYVGPLTTQSVTYRAEGCYRTALALVVSPAIALTSVTDPSGSTISTSLLHLDTEGGIVTYNDGYSRFLARYYDVVYDAGRTSVPADLKLAILELLKDYWSGTQRAGNGKPSGGRGDSTSNTVPGALWDLPFKVSRLIGPHRQIL